METSQYCEHLLSFVADCHNNIWKKETDSERALSYLKDRGLNDDSVKSHNIGFCHENQSIPEPVRMFGKELEKDFNLDDNGYSYFIRDRLIVPIYHEFGEIVGFSTRKPLPEKGNTWWNLPKPFYKGKHLFLIDKARKPIYDQNKVYIVEGYMDALILFQHGIKNVVAIMGTQFAERKVALILRYCSNVCLCLDIDENESGQKARDKAIFFLYELGFCENISVMDAIPMGEDPASFMLTHTIEELLESERILKDKEIIGICKEVRVAAKKNNRKR